MDELQKGDYLYYAQIFKPPLGEYNVIELKVHTINSEKQYFTCYETSVGKHMFLFKFVDFDKIIFTNKDTASKMVKEAEQKYGKVTNKERISES